MKNQIFISLIATCLLASCEMIAEVDIPKVPSKLVVTSFISPQDTNWQVYVGQTKPIFEKTITSEYVKDATVQLSNGSQTAVIPANPSQYGYYELNIKQAPFLIEAGKTYFLTVSAPDGRQVKAQCTIPISATSVSSIEVVNGSGGIPFTGTMKWQDSPNETNFYRCFAYTKYYLSLVGGAWEGYIPNRDYDRKLYKDTNRQGANFSWEIDMQASEGYTDKKSRFLFILLNTDENYYKYMTTRESASNNEGNPFAEPSAVFSNVEGGLGVFAGYQQTRLEVTK
jgi:hypothetical protein